MHSTAGRRAGQLVRVATRFSCPPRLHRPPCPAGRTALRVVVLDTLYCCVQLCRDLATEDLGFAGAEPGTPVQAMPLGAGAGVLALAAGGGALLAVVELKPPTLRNLLGALQVHRVPQGEGPEQDDQLRRLNPCAGEQDVHAVHACLAVQAGRRAGAPCHVGP